MSNCVFSGIGKHPLECDGSCYPSVLAYGLNGDGGFYTSSNTPVKYRHEFFNSLPIKDDNPQAYAVAKAYYNNVLKFVNDGVGLFFQSKPNPQNRLGTGTGKTHTAIVLGNEYIKARIVQHCKGEKLIEVQPMLFIRMAEFQNIYNKQFRGNFELQESATNTLNRMMEQMERTELLILDDISLRDSTESMTNLVYEIIDDRYINEKPIIFTSNYSISRIGEVLSPQIQSRIEGMTELVEFVGKDNRKGGVL